MQYLDPFPVTCEFCEHLAYYPLTPLKAEKAACTACKKVLRQTPRSLRSSSRKHGIEIWPIAFVFEVISDFDLDCDLIYDEDPNEETTLLAFIELIQKVNPSVSTRNLLDFDMLDIARSTCDEEQLLALKLKELALLSHPEEPLPDNNSLADPNVKGIEKNEVFAKYKKRRIARQAQDTLTGRVPNEQSSFNIKAPINNNLTLFWEKEDNEDSNQPLTDQEVQSTLNNLAYTLPTLYIQLMKIHNGGVPQNTLIQLGEEKPTNYHISTFIRLESIAAESEYMRNEWGYPDIGLYICNCPSAGHQLVALDYTECGPTGEPTVVHVDQENDFKKTILATNFEQFIKTLKYEDD
ncbi:SMI1/KNR4 family protein [Pseudoalteromonas sp. SR43-5]|uniref:SMI1/KNR4 family protein n=1 Tax=Pseudoalteromonas sp. SR43-5 TaxID=2760941 RepID=UPI0015FC272E|nr:SMI1/KNR4 family protein [Pseudoalteromonas sp. SR43-5]MBB1304362.1 SMI1/KNR4 family protein [Pseudoalteromonas sp. SR43-5]